jgi:hypothetical protein
MYFTHYSMTNQPSNFIPCCKLNYVYLIKLAARFTRDLLSTHHIVGNYSGRKFYIMIKSVVVCLTIFHAPPPPNLY